MKQIGAYDGAGGNERWSLVEIYLGADPCEGVDACKGRRFRPPFSKGRHRR